MCVVCVAMPRKRKIFIGKSNKFYYYFVVVWVCDKFTFITQWLTFAIFHFPFQTLGNDVLRFNLNS